MNAPASLPLVCGGLDFHSAPVELRERAAFLPHELPAALHQMRDELALPETVLLSTCNRVEYFAVAPEAERLHQRWPGFLQNYHQTNQDFAAHSFQLKGPDCVQHLFSLASGLKSMVVGETEIFSQIKQAYEIAQSSQTTGKWTNRLFQSSFAAAKEVRTHTGITRGRISVGSVAVELAEKIFGSLAQRHIMVIGAGETSERTARSLRSRGADSIIVANRTFDRAQTLARELDGRAVHWDDWIAEAKHVDIMLSSTRAPHYVLSRDRLEDLMQVRNYRPLFLIDLAVPRDFEPSINLIDDVYLYDIDDLQSIANRHLHNREAEISRSLELLKPHVLKYVSWAERQRELNRLADLAGRTWDASPSPGTNPPA
ncbi:MAG: glutamyl-tRNA reductase [Verrucomicrobiota bacterium]